MEMLRDWLDKYKEHSFEIEIEIGIDSRNLADIKLMIDGEEISEDNFYTR